MDAVQRPDQLHALKIRAVQLGQHGLDLRAVEHPHDRRLNDVTEVVTQGNLVAAQAPGLAVQVAPAHPGAEVTGGLLAGIGDLEDIRLEYGDRDLQQPGVGLDLTAVALIVAGIHHQEHQLKGVGTVALEHLHQLGHQHGVLAAGDAHGDLVPGLDQLIVLHRIGELVPDGLAVFFQQALLDLLAGRQYATHSVLLTCSAADGTRQTAAEILCSPPAAQRRMPSRAPFNPLVSSDLQSFILPNQTAEIKAMMGRSIGQVNWGLQVCNAKTRPQGQIPAATV